MTFRKSFDCYDFYDRAKVGEKCTQDDWDLMKIPMKAMELKQKYGLDFKGEFVPTDKDMMEKLFQAGFEMLLECGIYCTDTHRIVKYTEDEIWDAINNVQKEFTLGTGRDAVNVRKRSVGDKRKPIVQRSGHNRRRCNDISTWKSSDSRKPLRSPRSKDRNTPYKAGMRYGRTPGNGHIGTRDFPVSSGKYIL